MFFGQFEHNLDSKGRMTIPAKFRDALAGGLVITHGLDGCLWVYTKDEWKTVATKIASLSMANDSARHFKRYMFSNAADTIPDSHGRVIIPAGLREHAGIEREVIITGAMDKLEIWSPARWIAEQDIVTENPENMVAQLAELGL